MATRTSPSELRAIVEVRIRKTLSAACPRNLAHLLNRQRVPDPTPRTPPAPGALCRASGRHCPIVASSTLEMQSRLPGRRCNVSQELPTPRCRILLPPERLSSCQRCALGAPVSGKYLLRQCQPLMSRTASPPQFRIATHVCGVKKLPPARNRDFTELLSSFREAIRFISAPQVNHHATHIQGNIDPQLAAAVSEEGHQVFSIKPSTQLRNHEQANSPLPTPIPLPRIKPL